MGPSFTKLDIGSHSHLPEAILYSQISIALSGSNLKFCHYGLELKFFVLF